MTIIGMTAPEKAVYGALKQLQIPFEFQSSFFGGRIQRGGVIADFYIRTLSLIISVLGTYWHYDRGRLGKDLVQRTALEGEGVRVIFIDEEAAISNATYYVQQALMGLDHSRLSRI